LSKKIELKESDSSQFNKILKRNEEILRDKIMIRRDYINENDATDYLAEIRSAYSHMEIELSIEQEKRYEQMLSKVGDKLS